MRDIIAEDEESGQIDALKASTRDTQRSSSTFIPFYTVLAGQPSPQANAGARAGSAFLSLFLCLRAQLGWDGVARIAGLGATEAGAVRRELGQPPGAQPGFCQAALPPVPFLWRLSRP